MVAARSSTTTEGGATAQGWPPRRAHLCPLVVVLLAACGGAPTPDVADASADVDSSVDSNNDAALTDVPTDTEDAPVALDATGDAGIDGASDSGPDDAPDAARIDGSRDVQDGSIPPDVPPDVILPIDSGLDRRVGDRCPGISVAVDGTPTVVDTSAFATAPDVGTSCGSGSATAGFVDAVFTYTLATASNVTVNVTATGVGPVSAEVSTACGVRASAIAGCTTGVPSRRLYRSQPAGTYFVVVDFTTPTIALPRTLTVTIDLGPPTTPLPGDACPGTALAVDGSPVTFDTTMLAPDFALSCLASARADSALSFVAPPAGSDILANVASSVTGSASAVQLQRSCGSMPIGPCASRTGAPAITPWARYGGLTPGATYTLVAATNATTGTLTARAYAVPSATPVAITGNDACGAAVAIPSAGGIFTGTTVGATSGAAIPAGCAPGCTAGAPDVVYRLDLPVRRRVVMSMIGSTFDTLLFVQSGGACPGTSVQACNDDAYALASAIDVTLDPGTYWVIVKGCGAGVAGSYVLDVATVPP